MTHHIMQPAAGTHPAHAGARQARCPVCHGLECLCRPRYFSGQLLTEAELNAEQQYVVKKNQLHNLYLHGSGVVCGLEVVCHPRCEGWVTVKQGYAIGPCGDDIVVCEDADFDVLGRIEECERERQAKRDDCSPLRPQTGECDTDGCWYLTIEYKEQSARAMASLRADTQAHVPVCTCGQCSSCGCGNGNGNGNGNGGSTRTPLNVPCEPTRTCELYKLDLAHEPDEKEPTCEDLIEGTLLGRIYECATDALKLWEAAPHLGDMSDAQRYSACCRYLADVRRFFETHATTNCAMLDRVLKVTCPKPRGGTHPHVVDLHEVPTHLVGAVFEPEAGEDSSYASAVARTVAEVQALVLRHLIDCICLALMPPCPPDPGDDRLVLGCVTVRDGHIVDVCNWKGRRQAITWPVVRWWLSALPLEAALWRLLERLCCGEREGEAVMSKLMRGAYASRDARRETGPCDPRFLLTAIALLFSVHEKEPSSQKLYGEEAFDVTKTTGGG
jgi:hypothetical protein